MNTSNSLSHLSLIHPDDTEHPNTPVSNIRFNDSIDFRDSDYISSDITELSDETKESEESTKFGNEDFDVYNKVFDYLPPIPPTKEEEHVFPAPIIVPESDKDRIDFNMLKQLTGNDTFYARKLDPFKDKIGDGKMEYIKNPNTREMFTNAWKAITFSNNWDFVSEDVESFMWSNDPRIDQISEKMEEFGYNGHSGNSFGYTMRNMQFLVQNGVEDFKKLFEKTSEVENNTKFLDYSGGF